MQVNANSAFASDSINGPGRFIQLIQIDLAGCIAELTAALAPAGKGAGP